MLPRNLWLLGSSLFLLLGILHLFQLIFNRGDSRPGLRKDNSHRKQAPVQAEELPVSKPWTGFNLLQSIGLTVLGLANVILGAAYFSLVENSFFVSVLSILAALFYLWLAIKYGFALPFITILLAVACFILAPLSAFFA
jgi:hypothetical protein